MLQHSERALVERARSIIGSSEQIAAQAKHADQALQLAESKLREAQRLREDIDRIVSEKTLSFPWLADAIAQYYELCDLRVAEVLETRIRKAPKAHARVQQLAREKREAERKYRVARNRIRYYESLFPHLREYVVDGIDELVRAVTDAERQRANDDGNADPARDWLAPAEYQQLGEAERSQLALDRYRKRKKTSWEIGREFERFIGYQYERSGYRVQYHGATEVLADLGRDLIASKDRETLVIQCKYWSREKLIREKHVFQLYGTAVEYWIKQGGAFSRAEPMLFSQGSTAPTPWLITSAKLSDEAKDFARRLGVQFLEGCEIQDYPQIKCNVSLQRNERIYHLPFDQQYDRVRIEANSEECYVSTVAEAVARGFRRAHRWMGPDANRTGNGN